ncbi:hypothetical protein HMP06_2737 [Sphingomonas sp. HMP6]|nr:hypothetical protein HMP06_2737 [Sphingomonas sp. HMP6]
MRNAYGTIGIGLGHRAADHTRLTISLQPEIARQRDRADTADHAKRRAAAPAIHGEALFGDHTDGQARRLPLHADRRLAQAAPERRCDATRERDAMLAIEKIRDPSTRL